MWRKKIFYEKGVVSRFMIITKRNQNKVLAYFLDSLKCPRLQKKSICPKAETS